MTSLLTILVPSAFSTSVDTAANAMTLTTSTRLTSYESESQTTRHHMWWGWEDADKFVELDLKLHDLSLQSDRLARDFDRVSRVLLFDMVPSAFSLEILEFVRGRGESDTLDAHNHP